ncbi:hypothetical protein DNTS_028614 [Danionella cerebrum]|uniref:Protein FAM162B n=1 Tax=Danionella cerebrum TaxID=2873325 RepID=A0A553QM54_9TELE|nr:hypothetical protein DNTS_028614 [Danionella translucida]
MNKDMIFNAIRGSRAALGTLTGAWRRGSTAGNRQLCLKPQEGPSSPNPTPTPAPAPAPTKRAEFRIPGIRPSDFDKKIIVWSGRFKTVEQIPEFVSYEMIDNARNKVRVKVCYLMIGLTILGCFAMVYTGKKAAARHDTLSARNLERMARLRAEAQREKEEASRLAAKPQ